MNRTLWKTAYREILRSPGRFFAIFAIILLGSGFFVGLRGTRDAMVKTGANFLDRTEFYDFAASSTLGYTDTQVEGFRAGEGVTAAEGAVRQDAIVTGADGEELIVSFITLTDSVNVPLVTQGRLPEKPGECLGDISGGRMAVGDVLTLSDENDGDTADAFTVKAFTVVGLATSPLYLNYERGSTSLGSGAVSAFAIVPGGTFDLDYYTSVYIKLDIPGGAWSEEYDNNADAIEPRITALAEEMSRQRYDKIVADAEAELAGGEQEYADALSEYETERADAEKELNEALAELEDAAGKLEDGRREIADAKAELESETASAEAQIASSERDLAAARSTLNSGEAQYAAGLSEYESGEAQYSAGLSEYEAGLAEYEAGLSAAQAAAEVYGEEAVAETMQQLAAVKAQLDAAAAELSANRARLDAAKAQLDATRAQLDAGRREYNSAFAALNSAKAELAQKTAEAEAEIAAAEAELKEGEADYTSGMADYLSAKEEAEESFAEAESELADARRELDDARREIDDIETAQTYVIGRWGNVGYACFDNDSAIVRSVSAVFPVFFFLVAALICMTTVSRMVDEQRGQLGVLMALGYSKGDAMKKYLFYSGAATVLGCGVGIPGAAYLIPQILWKAYSIMYHFAPRLEYYLDPALALATFFLALFGMLFVTYLSLRGELMPAPANILRPKPPKSGKRVALERVGILWNALSFMWKVTLRNIFRYRERVLMMILGIGGCTALMITGFGIRDSIQNIVEYQYGEVTLYDYEVLFSKPLDAEDEARFDSAVTDYTDGVLFLHQESIDAGAGKTEKSAYLTVIPDSDRAPEFFSMKRGGEAIAYPGAGEAVINNGLADALGVKEGDTLTVSLGGGRYGLKIMGVFDNYIYNYVFVSADTYSAFAGGEPEIKTAFIKDCGGEATARILGEDNVLSVTAGSVLKTRIGGIMDNLIYIVLLTIICAAALAFIVIYDLTNININERMREIATVKVLGFYPGETAAYVLRENVLLTILGAAAGIPLGIALNSYVMSMIKVDLVYFTPRILPRSYVYSIALTFVFSLLVDLIMAVKLNKIDMASALKSAE